MPRKKRAYKTKIKGCYECSQRRIDCDRTQPQCQKCISKSLECSGLSIRHRFNNGVASRGKWAGKAMELAYQESYGCIQIEDENDLKIPETPTRTTNIQKTPSVTDRGPSGLQHQKEEPLGHLSSPGDLVSMDSDNGTSHMVDGVEDEADPPDESAGSDIPIAHDLHLSSDCILFQPSPDNVPTWKQSMLLHFSNHIAKEMVGIDGMYNGWRRLILPVAHGDELVMNAVLVVSAFHLSLNSSAKSSCHHPRHLNRQPQKPNPDQLYARAILGLQQRRELGDCDHSTKLSILLAILTLLTAVMVTGHSDFPTLFRMLQSALDTIGGEEGLGGGELAEFIIRQVHKMRVYAAPLLSERMGRETISSPTQMAQFFDCLNYCSWQHPEHALAVSFVTDLVHQARDIYLQQALLQSPCTSVMTASNDIYDSISRVQRFKETLEAFPDNSPGEQVLIWASFVAASDCILDEHKSFFKGVFLQHYARSGFVNLLRALDHLQKIWARGPGERWTSLLPQAGVFIM